MDDDAGSVCTERVHHRGRAVDAAGAETDANAPLNIENDLMTTQFAGQRR